MSSNLVHIGFYLLLCVFALWGSYTLISRKHGWNVKAKLQQVLASAQNAQPRQPAPAQPAPRPQVVVVQAPARAATHGHSNGSHGHSPWAPLLQTLLGTVITAAIVVGAYYFFRGEGKATYALGNYGAHVATSLGVKTAPPATALSSDIDSATLAVQCPTDGSAFASLDAGAQMEIIVPRGKTITISSTTGTFTACSPKGCLADGADADDIEVIKNTGAGPLADLTCSYAEKSASADDSSMGS